MSTEIAPRNILPNFARDNPAMKKICAAVSLAILCAICATSAGAESPHVTTDELERQLDVSLRDRNRTAKSFDCPDALRKEKGAQVKCTVVDNGVEYVLTVTFNEIVDDLNNIQITEKPIRVLPNGLAAAIKTFLDERGGTAQFIDCPDALNADKGSQVECAIVNYSHGGAVTITSNGVDDANMVDVRYDFSDKPNWWPRAALARHIRAMLKEHSGKEPKSVECPVVLKADDGAKVECNYVDNGLESTATLVSKGGSEIELRTSENPNRFTREGLEAHVKQTVVDEAGRHPDTVACPEEGLIAKTGQTQRCHATTDADQFGVIVMVTTVENGTLNYKMKRDE